ncbi:MAG: cupin domain-containing protein [Proteobacteria bacterium]|nr:cupin domain-containing protein [Pseudomonadota bacterium]
MPKIDPQSAPTRHGAAYPAPFDAPCRARRRWKLGDAAGLTQFGVNRLELDPGAWSSQRHWHSVEDEFVLVLEGEVVLIEEAGETVLRAGEGAGFPAGAPNGHHLVNRSNRLAVILEVGTRSPDRDGVTYPDIDLVLPEGSPRYHHRDGRPYGGEAGSAPARVV